MVALLRDRFYRLYGISQSGFALFLCFDRVMTGWGGRAVLGFGLYQIDQGESEANKTLIERGKSGFNLEKAVEPQMNADERR